MIAPVIELAAQVSRFDATGGVRTGIMENINWLLAKKVAALAAMPDDKNLQEQVQYIKDKMKTGLTTNN